MQSQRQNISKSFGAFHFYWTLFPEPVFAFVLLLVFVSYDPADVLFFIFSVYVVSGPLMWVVGKIKRVSTRAR